ncbi:sulfite exporter TauE/SafE family protein [Campylobacter sp. FMV-PI01]|uniref:Sulfite exporter TauE/SafE family protein n=1 Tax=Campylobacter portucalensis TaxID=2608384 RepID=A0A6L5WGI2_9BACT|nr:sulfite exporter TauE/SafE family protein [Campylobacter portucalensis]MSN96144.1 sulfite exporter TauE/SafE family protein [Campylobacter portucalensis]
MSYIAIFSTALFLSFAHCIGMCGGFVLAYSIKLAKKTKLEAFFYSISYHFARICAYVFLGILANFFGSIFAISSKLSGIFHFLVGVFLIILGAGLLKRGEILKFIENDKIWQKFFKNRTKNALKKDGFLSFLILGFLNGLIPCGVVYTFVAMAMLSKSVFSSILIMLTFGIATLFSLLFMAFLSKILNDKFKHLMFIISSVLIIIFGIYSAYLGFISTK